MLRSKFMSNLTTDFVKCGYFLEIVDISAKNTYFKCGYFDKKVDILVIVIETPAKTILIAALDFCVNVHLLTCIWYNV